MGASRAPVKVSARCPQEVEEVDFLKLKKPSPPLPMLCHID